MNRLWQVLRVGMPGVTRPLSAVRSVAAFWAFASLAISTTLGAIGGDALTGLGIGLFVLLVAFALVGWHGAFVLARQVEEFETPLLDLAFDQDDSSCHQEDWVDDASGHWLGAERYRVRVTNRSARTIDATTLSIVRFTPQGAPFLPMPMKVVGDDVGSRSVDQALHGGDRRYYEVAWVGFDRHGRPGEIALAYARAGVPNLIPNDRRYDLELRVQGRDTAPVLRSFEVWIEERRLRFSAAGQDADLLRASLRRLRDQKFADALTERRRLSIDILNRPTNTPALIAAWKESAGAWTQNVLTLMREHGCTPQQIASLESLGDVSIGAYDADPAINHLKSVHAEAIRRLERIIDAYSETPVFRT